MEFRYKTYIKCLKEYPSPNVESPNKYASHSSFHFKKGETYYVGVRQNRITHRDTYHLLDEKGNKIKDGYFIEKDERLFKELSNAAHFIID